MQYNYPLIRAKALECAVSLRDQACEAEKFNFKGVTYEGEKPDDLSYLKPYVGLAEHDGIREFIEGWVNDAEKIRAERYPRFTREEWDIVQAEELFDDEGEPLSEPLGWALAFGGLEL